jgi:O-antigen/teichoic acid export membrane protein
VTQPPQAVEPRGGGGLRRLAGASVVYGLGSVLTRGIAFLLLPLYTRHLSPTDYGIVAVTATVASVLGVIYPLGLQGAVARFYFATQDEAERRATNGTLWIASIAIAGAITLLLDRFGAFLFRASIPAVPFDPYIRLAIWTAFLTILGLVPLNVLQVQERPRAYVALSFGASLLTTSGIVMLVVWRNEGAYGYLRGGLFGGVAAALPYLVMAFRTVTPVVRWGILRAALEYSLPLVPHALAGWVLELSDRAILSRFVTLGEVGVYAIGYQLGAAMGIIVSAFTSAWVPILFRGLAKQDPAADRELSRLATYFIFVFSFLAVGWALLSPHVIQWLLASRYAEAYRVTQIVIAAYVLNALYIIPVGLLFWKKTTWLVPLVTLGGGIVNVVLNLWLVPRVGTMAAAWDTLIGYGVMLALAWNFGRWQQPFPYEYGQLARIVGLGVAVFIAGTWLAPAVTVSTFAIRSVLWLSFPLGLTKLGVIEPRLIKAILSTVRRR